jgi:hypothetical protein
MARRKQQETTGYLILAIFGAILLWLLTRGKSILHESVQSAILTPQGTVTPDPVTGAPQFDPRIDVPANEEYAIAPICGPGPATFNPVNPKACSCPSGYVLWKNVGSGGYECIPS